MKFVMLQRKSLPILFAFWIGAWCAILFGGSQAAYAQQCNPALSVTDLAMYDRFGISVATSGDFAIVGASDQDGEGLSYRGAAYIFRRSGLTSWVLEQKLLASDKASYDYFGNAVDIEGNTAVVVAPGHKVNGVSTGQTYIFKYDSTRALGSRWVEQPQKLPVGSSEITEGYRASVSLSGNVIAIGKTNDHTRGYYAGSAYVYYLNGSSWIQTPKLFGADQVASDFFGLSVAAFGDWVVVGSFGNDAQARLNSGAAYVFKRNYGTALPNDDFWEQQAKIIPPDGAAYDQFGSSVAIGGSTMAVGADHDKSAGTNFGSAYIYKLIGSTWTYEAEVHGSGSSLNGLFGSAVAVSESGDRVVVGAQMEDPGWQNGGLAYSFHKNGSTWVEEFIIREPNPYANNYFGYSVGASGNQAVVGSINAQTTGGTTTFDPMWCDDGNSCTNDDCYGGICYHGNKPIGTSCDDGNAATSGDQCQANGVCIGSGSSTAKISLSSPPNGFVEPLEDKDASSGTPLGTKDIAITFSEPVTSASGSALGLANFQVRCVRNGAAASDLQTGLVPSVTQVSGSGAGPYILQLSQRLCLGAWMEVKAVNVISTASGTPLSASGYDNRVVLGNLPMDITQDGRVLGDDISRWLAINNNGFDPAPLTKLLLLDQKRNGVLAGEDITRGIQLINGIGTFRIWSGFDMGPKP